MKPPKSVTRLAKYLDYVLGRRPDEIGLVPDPQGYVKIKELLKGLAEEEGWRNVRTAHLNEMLVVLPKPPIEISENMIRATHREDLPVEKIEFNPPKLLYTCIRRRAYPRALEKGILPGLNRAVVLSVDTDMALRMGKRIDPDPILLTVHVGMAQDRGGLIFRQVGQLLYLTDYLPAEFFSGPPLPKEKKVEPKADRKSPVARNPEPGSFQVDLTSIAGGRANPEDKLLGRKPKWKQDKKKSRKSRKERPPWRS
jgi:putative RNA 2'-phosphotransferase